MKLYVDKQFSSPYAMSAFVCLHEKRVPFELETVDLSAKDNHDSEFARRSVTRRVPMLDHDGFTLSESSAICEYIEDSFCGARLYPSDLRLRARARQIQAWLRSDLLPIRNERPTDVVFYGVKKAAPSADAQAEADRLFSAAQTVLCSGSDNLFGEWSIADLDVLMDCECEPRTHVNRSF